MSEFNGTPVSPSALFSEHAKALRSKEAAEIRESWQYKLLKTTGCKDKIGAVSLVVLAHSYYEAMETMLRLVFPGFKRLNCPLLTGTAKVMPAGQIVCDMHKTPSTVLRNVLLYDSQDELIDEFRGMADKMKLNDQDRIDMFAAVQRWVSQDRRLAPSVEYAGRA